MTQHTGQKRTSASEHQPEPKPGGVTVLPFVLDDINERAQAGRRRYW